MYQLKFHPQVKKQVKRLHPHDQKRLFKTLPALVKNPFSSFLDIKRLVDAKESYRLRIGSFRVIYSVDTRGKTIFIWEVGYRGGIY